MNLHEIDQRIKQLTDRIPRGTNCTDDNDCGGFLTPQEIDELEELFSMQLRRLIAAD